MINKVIYFDGYNEGGGNKSSDVCSTYRIHKVSDELRFGVDSWGGDGTIQLDLRKYLGF